MTSRPLSTHYRAGFVLTLLIGAGIALAVLHALETQGVSVFPLTGWQLGAYYGLPLLFWLAVLFWARSIDLEIQGLRRNGRFSASVIEVSTDAIIVIDERGGITLFSPAAERLFGYSRAEVMDRNIKMLMPEPDASAHDGYLARYLESGERHIIGTGRIVNAKHKDGREFPVRLSIGELQADERRYFVGVVSDFSARLEAERKIIQFRKAAEANPDLIYITDAKGRIEFINPAFTTLTGWTLEEIRGRTPGLIHSQDMPAAVLQSVRAALHRGEPWRGRLLITGKPGAINNTLWMEMTMAPIRDDHGAITGHVSLGQDVTEKVRQERVEAIARESVEMRVRIGEILHGPRPIRDKLTDTLDLLLSMEGLALQHKGGIFLRTEQDDPPRLQLFLTRGEFSAEFLEKEQYVALGACLCGRAAASGELLISNDCFCDPRHEHRFTRMEPHGHYIVPLSDSVHTVGVLFLYTDPYPDQDPVRIEMLRMVGQMVGLAIANDRMQQHICSARDAAMEATKAKSQFLANMSHEIRTPMNGLLGMLELLRDTPLAEKQVELVETGYTAALGLLGILNDILDYSKMEAGKLDLEYSDFDLPNLIDELGALFSARANKQGLEILCFTDPSLPRFVKGDATRLRQVLTNLLSNAIKFTPHGEVALTVSGDYLTEGKIRLLFTVRDSGIGIAPEVQAKLFACFMQADGSSTRGYSGTGLGLAISRQLVELMGGAITLESQPGSGSTFRFSLDLETAAAGGVDMMNRPDWEGMRVLVVDDNATNRYILEHYLDFAHIPYRSAAGGAEALRLLREGIDSGWPFTTGVLDMAMPEMDGLELTWRIKAEPELANLQILMLSSIGLDRDAAARAGIVSSLTKPVRRQTLMDALAGLGRARDRLAKPPAVIPNASTTPTTFHGHVLLVEDNAANQMVAKGLLTRHGLTTDVAGDGLEALARIASGRYDVVFMDCQMPVMDGYTATRELRQREQAEGWPHLPVIAMTANAMQGDRELCLAAGMDDYVAKPLTRTSLLAILTQWLKPGLEPATQEPAAAPLAVPMAPDPVDGPPPPAPPAGSPIDPAAIEGLREVMGAAVTELVNTYLANSPKLLNELRQALDTGDPHLQYEATHALKSSSALLGASVLSKLAAELETMGRLGQLAAPAQVDQLFAEFERARAALLQLGPPGA